jgi:hypothetical protein
MAPSPLMNKLSPLINKLTTMTALGLAAAALVVPLPGWAGVHVTMTDPRHYIDIGTGRDRDRNVTALEQQLKTEGAQCLHVDEKLELQVFNVDLAGRDEWWHRPGQDLRVMRDSTWPRMDVGYVWRDAQGAVLHEGREWVADMNYLLQSSTRNSSDPLRYEKAMLHEWLSTKLCSKKTAVGAIK